MSGTEIGKLLWELANGITAFAVVQGLVFAYACAKKEIGDVINRRRIKLVVAVMVSLIAIGQCFALWWCGAKLCALDADHCGLHWEATVGRLFCVGGLLVFSIVILYARQLLAHRPFDE
jgi:hypothetical protein